ncbi:Large-conductance mechanosensitive channel [bioreactor metagenome]|uniref:Large-conductance mechanosensitive channel n=1 Tax=bioreactor metagenome TaxID=1076179 RepID=A0A645HBH5_9ZZZZ
MKKGFMAEFKEFISRGNVMDLAVGIIIGTAFTAIIYSLVNDVIMPVLGRLISGINFAELKIVLVEAVGDTAEIAINYGIFIQKVIDFLLIALVVFIIVRQINRFRRKKEEPAAPAPAPVVSEEVKLLTEIRDLLRK